MIGEGERAGRRRMRQSERVRARRRGKTRRPLRPSRSSLPTGGAGRGEAGGTAAPAGAAGGGQRREGGGGGRVSPLPGAAGARAAIAVCWPPPPSPPRGAAGLRPPLSAAAPGSRLRQPARRSRARRAPSGLFEPGCAGEGWGALVCPGSPGALGPPPRPDPANLARCSQTKPTEPK